MHRGPVRPAARVPYSPFTNPYGFGWFPSYPLSYGDDFEYAPPNTIEPPAPPPVIVQQAPPQPVQPVQPVIHEYAPPVALEPIPAEEQPAFAIVLKDGGVRSAVAVAVQDSVLHYVDPDGEHVRLPLDAIDRSATRRVNRQRNLDLHLPAPAK